MKLFLNYEKLRKTKKNQEKLRKTRENCETFPKLGKTQKKQRTTKKN